MITSTTTQQVAETMPSGDNFDRLVREEIAVIVLRYTREAAEYSPATSRLWERIRFSLDGGKLTRPRLVKLGFDAFASRANPATPASQRDHETRFRRVILLGSAFEFLHTALLMHDDVIDRDFTRRGRPTLSALYRTEALHAGLSPKDGEHAGHSAGIIAGDLLLSAAISLAMSAGLGLPQSRALERCFQSAIHSAGAGELEDLLYSVRRAPANVRDVLSMEELKTASYSFRSPLQSGALLAGASHVDASALADIGAQLGIAYQLIDDVLGTFGDPETTGKSIDSDLREGKSTILTALAAEQGGASKHAGPLRGDQTSLDSLRAALETANTEARARRLAAELCDMALSSAQKLQLPPDVEHQLKEFSTLILNRRA